MGVIEVPPPGPIPMQWITNQPVWVGQWPLSKQRLEQVHILVQEQLEQGNIEPSCCEWNSPIFAIPKKSGKWRLLQDLRAVNAVLKTMGPLQLGIPSPNMIPKHFHIIIIDIQDCFFSIPLDDLDKDKFAFTVPSINYQTPAYVSNGGSSPKV